MSADTSDLIRSHAAKLKKILAKHRAGKALTPEELQLLGGASSSDSPAEQTSYDSMAAAAAAMNVPIAHLKRLKREGAPGFKGSRVYPLLLLPHLQQTQPSAGQSGFEDKYSLECAIQRRRLEDMEFESQKQRGLYNLKSDEDAWKRATAEKIKAILRTKLKNELPPKLEGLKAAEISAKMDPLIAEIVELFR